MFPFPPVSFPTVQVGFCHPNSLAMVAAPFPDSISLSLSLARALACLSWFAPSAPVRDEHTRTRTRHTLRFVVVSLAGRRRENTVRKAARSEPEACRWNRRHWR